MFASSLIVAGATACVAFAMASTLRGGSVADDVSSVTPPSVSLVASVAVTVVPVVLSIPSSSGTASCCCSENGVNGKVCGSGGEDLLSSCAEANGGVVGDVSDGGVNGMVFVEPLLLLYSGGEENDTKSSSRIAGMATKITAVLLLPIWKEHSSSKCRYYAFLLPPFALVALVIIDKDSTHNYQRLSKFK